MALVLVEEVLIIRTIVFVTLMSIEEQKINNIGKAARGAKTRKGAREGKVTDSCEV